MSKKKPVRFTIYIGFIFLALALVLGIGPSVGIAADAAQEAVPEAVVEGQQEEMALLAPPTLMAPAEGDLTTAISDPPLGVPSLRWEPVPGAMKYQVQVSKSMGFATTLVAQDTYATSHTPVIALEDGIHYWRVKAFDGKLWGPYSEIRSFDKDWSTGGTLYPQLLAPADGSQITAFSHHHFSWQPVQGAASYLLEISPDETFSDNVYSDTTIKPHHTPNERLGNNRYYWRVTPIDNLDHHGLPSEVWSFTFSWDVAPQPISPADNIDTPFLPRFSWTAVEAARTYQLEISTQDDFGSANIYKTPNTQFTPEDTLSNDQDYYWRVKAIDYQGTSSEWSPVQSFRTRWNFQTRLLTPLNNGIQRSYPFFSWTPIPGVTQYQIQIDKSQSFDSPIADEKIFNATSYAQPDWRQVLIDADYFWRVRGIDAQKNYTPWSDIHSFRISYTTTPNLIYPPYYYVPDSENLPVHKDETIAWPLFVWDTALKFNPDTEAMLDLERPDYYLLEVSADPTFNTVNFVVETAGLAAAPTTDHPFVGLAGPGLYYWRVRAIRNNVQMGSEAVWVTRIDPGIAQLPPSNTITPIHPADGFEAVEAAPVLGWLPVTGADHYRLQVSRNRSFTDILEEVEAQFVNYVPWQGKREPIPFGTYWWRVRAEGAGDNVLGDWSETRHFNLSRDIMMGNPYDFAAPGPDDGLLGSGEKYSSTLTFVAASPENAADPYDLGALHVMMEHGDGLSWVFAFETNGNVSENIHYGLYIDVDHVENSGGSSDPTGRPVTVDSLYYPEYVIYVERTGNSVDPSNVFLYSWDKAANGWDPVRRSLASIGGQAWLAANTGVVQLVVSYTAIGTSAEDFVGSVALTVFSSAAGPNEVMRDSVPSQGATIDDPAFVSDMLMPLYPFDTPLSNPIIFYELPSLRWRMPYYDSADGYEVQVARDARFTDLVETWETRESGTWRFFSLMPASFQSLNPYSDNESYYWRVRIRHERYASSSAYFDYGPWSPPMRFKLSSYLVGNPQVFPSETAQTTPSFSWDRVEGAAGYTIQIDDDANFSNPIINRKQDSTSFTPVEVLPDGDYYWRVATRRSDKVLGAWTPTMSFTKQSLTPTPISPINDEVVNGHPTLTWSPVIVTGASGLNAAAPRYRLQIDDDSNFGRPDTFTTEATSFTLSRKQRLRYNKLVDGTWYWRVAVIDAGNNVGAYSPVQQFIKEYLRPTLVSPVQGAAIIGIPEFEWEPLPGAAYYEIRIAQEENSVDTVRAVRTDNTRHTPTKEMSLAEFYWRVQMFDDDGIPGPSVDGQIAEQGPLLAIAADSAVKDEGNNGVTAFTFNVTRSGDIAGTTTANCNVTGYEPNPADGADFVGGLLPSVSVSFAPNETSAQCTINVLGDTNAELDESFQVMLTNGSEGVQVISGPAIGLIRNDDSTAQSPLLAIAADAAAKIEGNSGFTEFTFNVTRGGIITGTTTANCSVTGYEPNPADGADFVDGGLPSVPVTFAPNETSAQCTIRVLGDTSVEPDESFQVILTNVSDGAQITSGPATGTIRNDDSIAGITSTIYLPQLNK